MSMVKIVRPSGWDFDRPVAQMVKVSSRGLIGEDRRALLKIASPVFVDMIDRHKLAKDEVPVHLIALGASEAYGPNRNGDGFKEATCRQYHKTFEKLARFYRSHQNKDRSKSYGYVKCSAYNEPMRRVELLSMLNATKEAAQRNGGLVADREIEKLARGEDLSVSMACSVPHDICSNCKKQARTREEYCTEETCIGPTGEKRGGCRHNLTKVGADGHILHVDNPDPSWFDISDVYRPADRIAYGHRADYLSKAASDGMSGFMPGAELAELMGITTPLHVIASQDPFSAETTMLLGQLKLAQALAAVERHDEPLRPEYLRAFGRSVQPEIPTRVLDTLGTPGTEKAAQALGALADKHVILPLVAFAAWTGKSAAAADASQLLPGVYGRLAGQVDLENRLRNNPYVPSEKLASGAQRSAASMLAADYSLQRSHVQERAMRATLREPQAPVLKQAGWNENAAKNGAAVELAEAYGLYKLAALHRIASSDSDFKLTARLVVGQNRA